MVPVLRTQATPLQDLQQQANAARARMQQTEQTLETALAAYNRASEELQKTEAEIAGAQAEITRLQEDIAHNQTLLAQQAEFMYRSRRNGYLEILFSAKTVAEFTQSLELIGFLAANDMQTIENLRRQTRQLDQSLDTLAGLRIQQEKTEIARRADVNSARQLIEEQEQYLASLNVQVQELLERQQLLARQQQATRSAAASGSNWQSGSSGVTGSDGFVSTGVVFTGIASWYQVGTTTANGERFNPDALTAAHPSLPFNTLVRVTYRGRSVVVRINDRGPFTQGRIIDLSRGAAEVIGLRSAGIGTVTVEVVTRAP